MEKEELKLHILAILEKNNAHGYLIAKNLKKEGKEVSWGHLYPLLREMEKDGLIRGKREGKRKVYSMTGEGQKWLEIHLKNVREGIVNIRIPSISWLAKDLQEMLLLRKELHRIMKNLFRILALRDGNKIKRAVEVMKNAGEELEKLI